MTKEPSYPNDAPVGQPAGKRAKTARPGKPEKEEASGEDRSRRNRQLATGAAIGVGSAALVAALLYANRWRTSRGEPEKPLGRSDSD